LIQRRDSANGKRFPIMRKGKVIGAFGLDLSPLLARSAEILALSQKHREEAEELRGMKACIQKLRVQCLSLGLQGDVLNFVETTRNNIRRIGVTVLQATSIVGKLKDILQAEESRIVTTTSDELAVANHQEHEHAHEQTDMRFTNKMTASDGQNDRHKETSKSYTKKTFPSSISEIWASLTAIPAFYPDHPKSEHGLLQLLFEFGRMLRIDSVILGRAVSILGVTATIQVADQIASKADQVKCADNYLTKILTSRRSQQVGHGQLCSGT